MVALATGREVRNVTMGVYNPREKGRRWIDITAVPLFRPGEEKPCQVYTVFEDITLRIQAEANTKEAHARLATVMETAQVAICVAHDRQCRRITGNEKARQFLVGALNDETPKVRMVAGRALLILGQGVDAEVLQIRLQSERNEAVRKDWTRGLRQFGK